jgi:hypothetical protein
MASTLAGTNDAFTRTSMPPLQQRHVMEIGNTAFE